MAHSMAADLNAIKSTDHLVIIGNGITGITCATEVRKQSDCKITVISDEGEYFFSRPALMYIFTRQMRPADTQPYEKSFWKKNNIALKQGTVVKISTQDKKIAFADQSAMNYDKLLIATGSEPNKFGWPGQDLPGVQGFYSLQDLSLLERNAAGATHAVVVGGGLIGVEVAEMLRSRRIGVTFLVREKYFWQIVLPTQEAELVARHIARHGIDLRFESELAAIEAGADGCVARIKTQKGETIDCQIVALTAGVSPNIALARASGIAVKRGVLVNERFETSVPGIYAAGDCAEFSTAPVGRRNVEQVWYTGKRHAETLAQILLGKDTSYKPGIWFNSAKFFDLEYQVYGDVPAIMPAAHETFYWQNAAGDKCLRLNWHAASRAVTGVHAVGMRLRQDVCTRWIAGKLPVENAVEQLALANFDPEFFERHEREIMAAFVAAHREALHA